MNKTTIITRTNRKTGLPVTLGHADALGLCDGDGFTAWYTVCEDHDYVLGHESKSTAQGWFAHPDEWCDKCQAKFHPQSEWNLNNRLNIGDES